MRTFDVSARGGSHRAVSAHTKRIMRRARCRDIDIFEAYKKGQPISHKTLLKYGPRANNKQELLLYKKLKKAQEAAS